MHEDNSNLDEGFNPILDEYDEDPFEGFDKLQVEHASDTQARDEVRAKVAEEDSLRFEGFKERLPEGAPIPEAVRVNSEASREFKRVGNERRVSNKASQVALSDGVKKTGGRKGASARPVHVDEELEKSTPFVEVVEPRVRVKQGGDGGESSVVGDGVGSLTPGEKWAGKAKKKRYRYVGENGLLNGAELEFFRENETSRRAVMLGDGSLDYLRPGLSESDEDRKKRVEKVTQAVFGRDAFKRNSKKRWSRKHQEFLEFLAKFKYATPRSMAKMFSEAASTSQKRLKELRSYGLVIDKKILGGEPLWFLTDAGMLLSGYDMPKVTEGRITYTMLPHQYAVNHLAANLWGAGINVLNEDEYPHQNRVDLLGKKQFGDVVVSEQEIQSSFGKLKLFSKADVYLPTLKASIERKNKQWEDAGGVSFGPSPEFQPGNEYMWAIFPPAVVNLAYHVPDLVVARQRNADGTPNSIAVELEIQNKPVESYRKALTAYRYSTQTYKQVVWVCQKASSAKKIRELATEMGMIESGALRIVPIVTQDGIFKGRDLWTL